MKPVLAPSGEEPQPQWWKSCLLVVLSAVAWVASIPLLMAALGGALQPHLGWPLGVAVAIGMFVALVQGNQRLATCVVFLVSFTSAWLAGSQRALGLAICATGLTMLNGIQRLCRPCPTLLDFQCRYYPGYHRRSQLRGALETMLPGNSFYACHPHGVLSVGWVSNVVWNRRFHHAAGRCFYLIDKTLRNKGLLARLLCDAYEGPHGGLRDNQRDTIVALMARGESVCTIPGAYQEATHFSYGRERVVLSSRKGFIKYCLRFGYRVHPVYSFGEAETYYTFNRFDSFRLWLNTWGIPTVVFFGLRWCPLLPRTGLDLLTFVGPPLELPLLERPSDEEVDIWHSRYVEALRRTFDRHKAEAGKPGAVLEVL